MFKAFKRKPVFAGILFFMVTSYISAGPPCPAGSAERPFQLRTDLSNCVFGPVEGNSVYARYGRIYNVYCPGRMSKSQAIEAATALAQNEPRVPGNPIPRDFALVGLTPRYQYSAEAASGAPERFNGVHHWFHYGCTNGGRNGVATHIKIEIGSNPTSRRVAQYCSEVNREGSIRDKGNLNIEYRCRIHLLPEDRQREHACSICEPPSVYHVAQVKVSDEVAVIALDRNLKTCLFPSTDIQCAPCKSSDKLVARLTFVRRGGSCPAHANLVEPSCKALIQDRIAWDREGHTHWEQANLERLCGPQRGLPEPAKCFDRVMHGSGISRQLTWQHAVELCSHTLFTDLTIQCFQREIQNNTLEDTIVTCRRY